MPPMVHFATAPFGPTESAGGLLVHVIYRTGWGASGGGALLGCDWVTRQGLPTSLLLALVLLASGCASLRIRGEAAKLEQSGDLESAYELLSDACAERPTDKKLLSERVRVGGRLAQGYRADATQLAPKDLPGRLVLLERAALFDAPELEMHMEWRERIERELGALRDRITAAAALDPLARIRLAWDLHGYSPYVAEVAQFLREMAADQNGLAAAISSHSDPWEALLLDRAAERLWPAPQYTPLRAKILSRECGTLDRLASRYEKTLEGRRVATAAFYHSLVASYCEADPAATVAAYGRVATSYMPAVRLSGAMIPDHRELFERHLGAYSGKYGFMLEGRGTGDREPDVLAHVDVQDIGVDIDQATELRFSKYLAGYRQDANPTYQQLLVELQNAQIALQNANAIVATNAFLVGWKIGAVAAASGLVSKVQKLLRQTPPYLQVPIYADYQYQATDIVIEPRVQLRVVLWDRRERLELMRKSIDRTTEVRLTVLENVHPQDVGEPRSDQFDESTSRAVLEGFSAKAFEQIAEELAVTLGSTNVMRAQDAFTGGYYDAARDYLFAHAILVESRTDIGWSQTVVRGLQDEALVAFLDDEFLGRSDAWDLPRDDLKADGHVRRSLRHSLFKRARVDEMAEALDAWQPLKFNARSRQGLRSRRPTGPRTVRMSLPAVGARPPGKKAKLSVEEVVRRSTQSVVVIESAGGSGSGFVVRGDGLIVTNAHVVEDVREVSVRFANDTRIVGEVVARSVSRDLAVVRVPLEGLRPLVLGDVADLEAGQAVVAIGAPYGFAQTVTSGIVSAVRRGPSLANSDLAITYVQTDAAINKGNSGGPLLSLAGEVVAVNTLGFASMGLDGLSLSVAINEARLAFPELLASGSGGR